MFGFQMSVTLSMPRSAADVYNTVVTISGVCLFQMVHMMRTAEQQSQPMIPQSLFEERLPLSAESRDLKGFAIVH